MITARVTSLSVPDSSFILAPSRPWLKCDRHGYTSIVACSPSPSQPCFCPSMTQPRSEPQSGITSIPVDEVLVRHLPRAAVAGLLMGLANLVPGISGGTMLLAAGVYTDFIESVAKITRLQLERRSLLLLLVISSAAALGILAFAGPVKDLVIDHRWIMYSLFVGLTLGGIPALWRMARPGSVTLWVAAGGGFGLMFGLALAQGTGAASGSSGSGFLPLLFAGFAGAASMILPGISGGYILLLMGQYVPILTAIETVAEAVGRGEFQAAVDPVVSVFVPVALGLVVGVAAVSNLLRYLLREHSQATLGVLLGLLTGVVVGLWPFQDAPLEYFEPTRNQAAAAVGLVLSGAIATLLITRIGDD